MDEPPPLNFDLMYISSSDTLCGSPIDQKIKDGWNDHPPLFKSYPQEKKQSDEDMLLKGMLRSGIPPVLRCAVWLSNVVDACHPHQDKGYSDAYRTLGRVRLVDRAWDTVLHEIFPDPSDARDALPPSFGNAISLQYHDDERYPVMTKGKQALTHVLCALEHIIGLDFCPLLPPLAGLFLRFLSESYAFCALREMVCQNPSFYFPTTQIEHYAWCQAFGSVLERLHPQTAACMRASGVLDVKDSTGEGLSPIFQQFFLPILPYDDVLRMLDIYTFEGHKVLFRFGIALLALFKRDVIRDDMVIATPEQWWWQLREYTQNSGMYSFSVLCKKAYGYHGNRVRKRLRFPRRQILARIIKLEEDRATDSNIHFETVDTIPRPLGLMENENIKLGKSAQHRAHLAHWLPPTLRLTKLDLIYSTDVHGRTLESFYRNVKNTKQTILLAQVLDNDAIVGCFASQAWRQSHQVYGDGECFLFRLDPDAKCWKWKPDQREQLSLGRSFEEYDDDSLVEDNNRKRSLIEQFMVGRDTFISMGGSDGGGSGLRFNEDLTKGESSTANGFHNEPLSIISNFDVGIVEVYQLARAIDGKTAAQVSAESFHRTL